MKPLSQPTVHLLTSYYPFGHGEEFLPTEFPYLLDRFREIILYPTKITEEPASQRMLEDGVRVSRAFIERLVRLRSAPSLARLSSSFGSWASIRAFLWGLTEASRFGIPGIRALMKRVTKAGEILTALEFALGPSGFADIYYSYWLDEAALAIVQLKWSTPLITSVARAHGFDLYSHRQDPPYQPVQGTILRSLDRAFAISEHGAEDLRRRHGENAATLEVWRLGVEAPGFRVQHSTDGVLRLVSCSSVVPLKRLHLVGEALRRTEFPVQWTHLGSGPGLVSLMEAVATLPASVEVRLPGRVPHSELMEFYRTQPCDLFVNLSRSEGIPVSIMEALSVGLPVVATDVGGTSELVSSEHGYLLSPDPSPQEISSALHEFADLEPKRRRAMGTAGIQRVAGRFNAAKQYKGFAASLEQIARAQS